ncbi:649_t:CDS:2, partial [Acaulospora colombiana]
DYPLWIRGVVDCDVKADEEGFYYKIWLLELTRQIVEGIHGRQKETVNKYFWGIFEDSSRVQLARLVDGCGQAWGRSYSRPGKACATFLHAPDVTLQADTEQNLFKY